MTNGSERIPDASHEVGRNIIIANGGMSNYVKKINEDEYIKEEYRLAVGNLWEGFVDVPKNWDSMTVREQRDWSYLQVNRHMPNVPKSLSQLIVGWCIRGDCDRPTSAPTPDWLDREKFLRGQRFAMNHVAGVFFAELVSLFGLFTFENALKPLIITDKSSEPFSAFERYLSTAYRVMNWYSSDPWSVGTPAYRDIQAVRRMHTAVRNKLYDWSLEEMDRASKIEKTWDIARSALLEDFRGSCTAAASGQCPYAFSKEDQYKRPKGMSQSEMAATQSGFICFTILYPEYCGIHGASDEDLEAFCHVWRGIGYLLGMEDEFNFCNGTLEEVKQRSRDFLEYWVKPNLRDVRPEWEHMLRCLMGGLGYYVPMLNFENGLLYFADMLNIRLPRLEASLGYRDWLRYKLFKVSLYWTSRLPWVPRAMNRGLLRRMKRGSNYTQQQIEKLKKHSAITLANGLQNAAAESKNFTTPGNWHKNSIVVLLSTCLLVSSLLFMRTFAKKFSFV